MNNFYNPYMMQGNYVTELQNMRDRIDNQIQQVQNQQRNMQQPTNLTQNFQLAPNNTNNVKFINNFEDVQKEIVVLDTYFFNNDMSNMWIKNTKGEIRTFTITEIIPKDEKDILIENLQKQINELKGGSSNEYAKPNDEQLYKQSSSEFNTSIGKSITTNEPSNVSDLSNSKKTKYKSN